MVDKNDFRLLQDETVWRHDLPESGCEVIIAGDEYGPDAEHLKHAQRVVNELEILLEWAKGLLEEFIDYKKLELDGNWNLESIEFGRGIMGFANHGDFEMLLTIEPDTYALWSVGFKFSPSADEFFPHQFGRRQD